MNWNVQDEDGKSEGCTASYTAETYGSVDSIAESRTQSTVCLDSIEPTSAYYSGKTSDGETRKYYTIFPNIIDNLIGDYNAFRLFLNKSQRCRRWRRVQHEAEVSRRHSHGSSIFGQHRGHRIVDRILPPISSERNPKRVSIQSFGQRFNWPTIKIPTLKYRFYYWSLITLQFVDCTVRKRDWISPRGWLSTFPVCWSTLVWLGFGSSFSSSASNGSNIALVVHRSECRPIQPLRFPL